MGDTESSSGPEFSAEERELIKDLVFDGQSLDAQGLKSWLDAKCPPERVRREVERLLHSASNCDDRFLRQPASDRYLGISRNLPARIGRYPVIEQIGAGGMGIVYSAFDEELNRRVAIKVLQASSAGDPEMQKRLLWDAKAASALQHPNIVTVHEVGSDNGSEYMVMECIAGKTLGHLIPEHGLDIVEALGYAIQIAGGLEAAHQAGIVHRDLKPGNVMITDTGVVKLLDFGLAKGLSASFHTENAPRTFEGKFAGTATYVSPEQAEGKSVDIRSDIFSFGSVLFEMLTGRRAFPGDSTISVLAAILRDDPPSTVGLDPQIDPRIDEIVRRCLRKDKTRRFQSIGDVAVRLREIQEEIQYSKLDRTAAKTRTPDIAKRLWIWLLGGVVLGAGFAASVWGIFLRTSSWDTGTDRDMVFTRVTSDQGLTESPALSPDGKLLAYASDRSGTGNLDIWVQQLKDGELTQLTHGTADNCSPVFSPDGARLAFRSKRDGGGIYGISTMGGSDRLLAPKGQGVQFSPDGQSIAYWTGVVGGDLSAGSAEIYILSLRSGAAPRKFRTDFRAAAYPFWSPRGDRLLFLGRDRNDNRDWWVASIDGSYARPTHVIETVENAGLHKPRGVYWITPAAWLPSGKVLFSARSGDATNVWSVDLSEDGTTKGPLRRLTSGTTIDLHPSAIESSGRLELAFDAQAVDMDVWQMPLDVRGLPSGARKRLTFGLDTVSSPSISWDGTRLTYAARVPDGQAVRLLGLGDGRIDTHATVRTPVAARPVLSGNGQTLAYSDTRNGYVRHISSGQTEKICESCSLPTHLSFDGEEALFEPLDSADQIWICSGRNPRRPMIPWAGKPVLRQFGARFSPDGRWVVFSGSRFESLARHIWIAPLRKEGTVGESDLIAVTDGDSADIEPYWSPDGRTIYYLSNRDGFQGIWARRVNPVTAQPLDAAFPVFDAHNARQTFDSPSGYPGDIGLSVARDSLVLMMSERTGNIWLRKEPTRKR